MVLNYNNWQNLLNYYISCLQREGENKLSFFESGNNDKFFMPFEAEHLFSSQKGSIKLKVAKNTPLQKFVNENKNNKVSFFYGYPLFSSSKLSSRKNYYTRISPILFSEISISYNSEIMEFELLESLPNINENILKDADLSYSDIDYFAEYFSDLMVEEDNRGSLTDWLTKILEHFQEITNFNFYSELDLNHFNKKFPPKNIHDNFILNNSIIFISEKQNYNDAIIRELEALKDKRHYDSLEDTALYPILTQNADNFQEEKDVFLVSEINSSQLQAVKNSLNNKLTVVGGPPGTGKSQVVLNLISSAILNNQTSLLVSWTNAAVSVITNYFSNEFDYPIILRTGKKEIKSNAIDILRDVKDGVFSHKIKENEINNTRKNYYNFYDQVFKDDIDTQRNYQIADEMAELTDQYQKLEPHISNRFHNWISFSNYKSNDWNKFLDRISEFANHTNTLITESQQKILKRMVRGLVNYFNNQKRTDLIENLNKFLTEIKAPILIDSDSDLESIFKFIEKYKQIFTFGFIYNHLEELKKQISELPTEEDFINRYEENEKEMIDRGKNYLRSLREYSVSKLNHREKQKFSDFVDAQEKLLNFPFDKDLKKIEADNFHIMKKMFPAWAMNAAIALNSMFPLKAAEFDLLIIDEASQCDIASMIPLLFRCSRACVIGDVNQLNHIVTFNERIDKSLAKTNSIPYKDHFYLSYKSKSIYEVSKRAINDENGLINLDEHYRSHPDIIRFSNDNFYGRHLKVYTNPSKLKYEPKGPAVAWIDVKGNVEYPKTGSALNKTEANKVWEITIQFMKKYFQNEEYVSLGIVTPLRAHVEYLKDVFEKKSRQLDEDTAMIYEAYTNYAVPFNINTVYRYQGDERDLIIFSTIASNNIKPGSYRFINERQLLNVAITRARTQLIIVGDKEYIREYGNYLGKLADYTDGLLDQKKMQDVNKVFQSPIEEKLFNKMYEKGLDPKPQYNELGFNIDFAIIKNGKKVAVECNGISTHRTKSGKSRKSDVIRKRKLTNAGWKLFIFWSWDIMQNSDKCVHQIENYLNK